MIKQDMVLGPWSGGLNTRDEPSAIADNELVVCKNFVVTADGSLQARPSFTRIESIAGLGMAFHSGPDLGCVIAEVDNNPAGGGYTDMYAYDVRSNYFQPVMGGGAGSTDSSAKHTPLVGVGYYLGKYYFFTPAAIYYQQTADLTGTPPTSGSNKTTLSGLSTTLVVTSVGPALTPSNMNQRAPIVFIHKERMFVVTGDKVYYSKPTDPTIWASPDGGNFAVTGAGRITDAILFQDNIYIVAESALFRFSFQTDPRTDGYVTRIGSLVNGSTITTYEGRLFVNDVSGVYEYVGSELMDISKKVSNRFKGWSCLSAAGEYLFLLPYPRSGKRLFAGGLGVDGSVINDGSFVGDGPSFIYHVPSQAWTELTYNTNSDPWLLINPHYGDVPRGKLQPIKYPNTDTTLNGLFTTLTSEPGFVTENGFFCDPAIRDGKDGYALGTTVADSPMRKAQAAFARFDMAVTTKRYNFTSSVEYKRHYFTMLNREAPDTLANSGGVGSVNIGATETFKAIIYSPHVVAATYPAQEYSSVDYAGNVPDLGRVRITGGLRFTELQYSYTFYANLGALPDIGPITTYANARFPVLRNIYTRIGVGREIMGGFSRNGPDTGESVVP